MRRVCAVLLAAGLVSGADAISAQEPAPHDAPGARTPGGPGPVTVREATERALASHPSLAVASAREQGARADLDRSRADRWPDLSLSGSATQYELPMIVRPIHDFQPGATPPFDRTLVQGAARLEYTLFEGGGRSARIRGARAELDAAGAGLRADRQELLAGVVGAYLRVLTRRRVLRAHDRRAEALESELDRVVEQLDVGRAAPVDRLRVEAAAARAEAERVRVREELGTAWRTLGRLMGADPEELRARGLTELSPGMARPSSRGELYERARARSPELGEAGRRVAAAEAAVGLARGARLPRLDLEGAWIDRGSAGGDFEAEWNLGVRVSVPVFTGGRISASVARAEADRRRAQASLREASLRVEEAVDRAMAAREAARARVESLEKAVARASEVARVERLRVETGAGTQTDYLDAEAALLEVRAELAGARSEAVSAGVEIARATGELEPGWIERHLSAAEVKPEAGDEDEHAPRDDGGRDGP